MLPLAAVAIVTFGVPATAYLWPSPMLDALENYRYDQLGINSPILADFVNPCTDFIFANGGPRSDAADWIRTVSWRHGVLL